MSPVLYLQPAYATLAHTAPQGLRQPLNICVRQELIRMSVEMCAWKTVLIALLVPFVQQVPFFPHLVQPAYTLRFLMVPTPVFACPVLQAIVVRSLVRAHLYLVVLAIIRLAVLAFAHSV